MTKLSKISIVEKQCFSSYEEWNNLLKKYSVQERQIFRKSKSEYLTDTTYKTKDVNSNLQYKRLIYKCKFGNDAQIRGTGLRKTRTCRLGCSAFIQLNVSSDRQSLVVKQLNLSHTNHDETKAFYHLLPENRSKQINEERRKQMTEMLSVYGNKKLIQTELARDKIYVTLKDLTNIKATTKSIDGDNLQKAVDYLIKEQGADVDICVEDNQFKGLFFCTEHMKRSFDNYPEMVFIDGTYKLLMLNFTVVILMVEDSNGTSEVVAVGLLVTEDAENYKWFLQTFCKYHPESMKKVKCIMSDKDTTERGVLEQIFVGVPLYICRFHTMQIFKRRTLNLKNKKEILEILQKLVYSPSTDKYNDYYDKLCSVAEPSFLKYFDENWHHIRDQWTEYGMVNGNMGNCTNNRVESTNQKLKDVIRKRNSLKDFLVKFFQWYCSHEVQNDAKLAKCFTTKPVNREDLSSVPSYITYATKQYEDLLTTYAFDKIKESIDRHIPLTFIEKNTIEDKFRITTKSGIISVTSTTCECSFWIRYSLPCHHILSARNEMNLPLYDEELCASRWTKTYVKHTHRTFDDSCIRPQVLDETQKTPTIVKKISKKTTFLTVPEKERKIRPLLNTISHNISTSCGAKFEKKYSLLRQLSQGLTKDCTIQLVIDDMPMNCEELESSFANLCVSDNNSENHLRIDNICMPVTPKIRGRPSRFLATTPKIKKTRKNVKT